DETIDRRVAGWTVRAEAEEESMLDRHAGATQSRERTQCGDGGFRRRVATRMVVRLEQDLHVARAGALCESADRSGAHECVRCGELFDEDATQLRQRIDSLSQRAERFDRNDCMVVASQLGEYWPRFGQQACECPRGMESQHPA